MFGTNFGMSSNTSGVSKTERYKTSLCKHYNTPKGCVYGEKCQFAHGESELRGSVSHKIDNNSFSLFTNQNFMDGMNMGGNVGGKVQKKTPNPANFKIVKCKNFERDGMCKYGNACTFAHGDADLRAKTDNFQFQQSSNYGFNPYMMDPNFLMYMNQMGFQGGDMSQISQMQQQMYGANMSGNMGGNIGGNMGSSNASDMSTGTNDPNSFNLNPDMSGMMNNNFGFYPITPQTGQNPNTNN